MSSDSGSAGLFREMEDGFAAYAASKAALNMAVRHMAAELKRLRRENEVLRQEREILKRATAFFAKEGSR